MASRLTILLMVIVVLAIIVPNSSAGGGVAAFGAGNIPGFAYLEGKAFRHGDIEDTIADLLKRSAGGGLLGLGSGTKFGGLDVKRIYFGNWLRDYSQAVDIASLKQVQLQTILNIIMVLGFLSNGYATGPFEVTPERLGTYLPVEHIDNPKGYGEGEDPRKYHPKLRGPVHPQEYAVDPDTGMKNYIANERGHWDTSRAHVRRLLEQCIDFGRRYRQGKNQIDKYEAYRQLGSALHTMEDFFAHSNFCELSLISIGGWNVFAHCGDNTKIRAPNGHYVYPLVTGTFGGSDFIHSLLGEASDHLSQTSIEELNTQMNTATKKRSMGGGSSDNIRDIAGKIPGLSGGDMDRDMANMDRSRANSAGKDPNNMSPQEIRDAIWPVLVFRDNLVTKIEVVIEKIPGLQALVDSLMESIQVFVLTTLEPFIRPLITTATGKLQESSGAVINNHDQFEVFRDPNCSDPTHSFLSKDHFGTILNEPAGNLAKIVVAYAVPKITAAWENPNLNPREITEDILQCMFHPDWHNRSSKVQVEVMTYMGKWMNSHGSGKHEVERRLGKEAVKNHENMRFQGQVQGVVSAGAGGISTNSSSGPNAASSAGMAGAIELLGKFGISNPLESGGRRDFDGPNSGSGGYGGGGGPSPGPGGYGGGRQTTGGGYSGGGQAASYYNSASSGPGGGYSSPPHHQSTFPSSGGYGGPPSYPGSGGGPMYSPPSGPPPPSHSTYPGAGGGGMPSFPSGPSPGFPEHGRNRDLDRGERAETKEERKARKKEKKKHKHGNWDEQDYRPGKDSDSEDDDSDDDKYSGNKKRGGSKSPKPPAFPSSYGGGGSSYHSGSVSGGFSMPDHPREREGSMGYGGGGGGGGGYAPPPGPPPGQSSYYAPPPGPPPGGPGFPPTPGFGGDGPGYPSMPMGGNMMPSAFPGYNNSGGGGYGGPPSFPGSGGGSGYPGAGGRHQYDGGSSGW